MDVVVVVVVSGTVVLDSVVVETEQGDGELDRVGVDRWRSPTSMILPVGYSSTWYLW